MASPDKVTTTARTVELNVYDPLHESALFYKCCRGKRIRYQRLAALVASKFCVVAVIAAVASLFTKPRWYYIDHENHMLAKMILMFLLFGMIVVASMKKFKKFTWAPYLYVPYLVVGPLLIIYDIYKLGYHIHETVVSHQRDEGSPYIYFKVVLGAMEVFAVSFCWYVTFHAFKSMKAEKEEGEGAQRTGMRGGK